MCAQCLLHELLLRLILLHKLLPQQEHYSISNEFFLYYPCMLCREQICIHFWKRSSVFSQPTDPQSLQQSPEKQQQKHCKYTIIYRYFALLVCSLACGYATCVLGLCHVCSMLVDAIVGGTVCSCIMLKWAVWKSIATR